MKYVHRLKHTYYDIKESLRHEYLLSETFFTSEKKIHEHRKKIFSKYKKPRSTEIIEPVFFCKSDNRYTYKILISRLEVY